MAYRCERFDKILVGPAKRCDSCDLGGFDNPCDYRVWQEGVLKEGGQRTRGVLREIWPRGIHGPGLYFSLGADGNYHCGGVKSDWNQRETRRDFDSVGIRVLHTLTPQEMEFVKRDCRHYFELLENREEQL